MASTAYMFQIELPEMTETMIGTIPAQRAHTERLFMEGKLMMYSVSMQRSLIWCVVQADDEQEAMEVVAGFPMHAFFTDVTCHALLFHNTVTASLPDISLN